MVKSRVIIVPPVEFDTVEVVLFSGKKRRINLDDYNSNMQKSMDVNFLIKMISFEIKEFNKAKLIKNDVERGQKVAGLALSIMGMQKDLLHFLNKCESGRKKGDGKSYKKLSEVVDVLANAGFRDLDLIKMLKEKSVEKLTAR